MLDSVKTQLLNSAGSVMYYTLFQTGRHLSIILFTCKLALVASFKGRLEWRPFWNKAVVLIGGR